MISPYKAHLASRLDTTLTIHRRDAAALEGKLVKLDDFGCTLRQSDDDEFDREIFIAYEDIRGVVVYVRNEEFD